jgi:arginyl-tRNA--protein-N-Asp/Glu arginylyltransferase
MVDIVFVSQPLAACMEDCRVDHIDRYAPDSHDRDTWMLDAKGARGHEVSMPMFEVGFRRSKNITYSLRYEGEEGREGYL